jgi:hypothetical protein
MENWYWALTRQTPFEVQQGVRDLALGYARGELSKATVVLNIITLLDSYPSLRYAFLISMQSTERPPLRNVTNCFRPTAADQTTIGTRM